MLKVGITGGIGSGKSLVCRILSVFGVPVFHADLEARRLMDEDTHLGAALRARFPNCCHADGSPDRKALATLVFHDPEELAALNALVHPAVRDAFVKWAEVQQAPYVVMEAAILAESGGHRHMDRVVTVEAPEEVRLARVMARDGSDADAVRARMRNQAGEETRRAVAQHVLINDGRQMLLPQVLALHEQLNAAGKAS